ncbi:MAG: hypothetical protein R3E86_13650 [Pseudomonadales bacterium]
MNNSLRLSRLKAPRANTWTLLLLVAVFIAFGVAASALQSHPAAAAPDYLDQSALLIGNWLWGG